MLLNTTAMPVYPVVRVWGKTISHYYNFFNISKQNNLFPHTRKLSKILGMKPNSIHRHH